MYFASTEYLNHTDTSITRTPCSKVVIDGVEYSGRTHLKIYPKISHVNTKMIGGFSAATCEFEIYNIDGTVNLNGKEVDVYRGLEINGVALWIPMGIFSATDDNITNNKTARSITFKGYDRAALFDVAFVQGEDITFPCTLLDFVEKLCARRGVRLENNNFPMASFVIETALNIPADYTERQLISCAAELGGCIARINRAGNLEISKPFSTGRRIPRTRYSAVSQEPAFGPINSVVFGHEGYNDDIVYPENAPDNLCEWRIEDNPFVEKRREELIADIAANIIGMSFVPFKITDCVEDYIFDINDSIEIESKDGTVFTATVLSKTTSSRIRSELKAETQNGTSTNRKIAGSVKDAIKRVQLDVDHQNNRINALVEDSASRAELEILSDAINMRFDDIEKPDTVENVTNAVTTINKDGVSIINGSLTLKDNNNNILIGVNNDENGDMYVSGNIRANSLEADSVDAEAVQSGAVTADKLSVGEGEFVNILSTTNPDSLEAGNGLLGYNLDIQKESNYLLAKPKIYSNLFGEVDGEFISTKIVGGSSSSTESTGINGWVASNGTYSNYFANQGLYFLMLFPKTSSTTTTNSSVHHLAYLRKGAKYSLSAQINCNNWSAQNSTTNAFWYRVGDSIYTFDSVAKNQRVSNKEMTIEFVFEYKGETGEQKVGLAFAGLATTRINIAWVNLNEVLDASSRANGFYCTERTLITEDKYLLNSGALINSAVDFQKYISSFYTGGDTLFIALQKIALKTGKKYVLTARIRAESLSKTNEPKLMYWVGAGYTPIQQSFRVTSGSDVVVQFVFRYTPQSEAETTDFGLAWKGLLKSDNTPVSMRIYWMTLWEDETSTEGFYSSYGGWLDTKYLTDYTLPDSLSAKIYAKTNALKIVDGYLMLYGNTQSNEGYVGCLDFSPKEVAVNGTSVVYQAFEENPLELSACISSSAKLIKPNSLAGDFNTLGEMNLPVFELSVGALAMAHASFEAYDKANGDIYKTYVTPAGIYIADEKTFSCITPQRLYINGKEVDL